MKKLLLLVSVIALISCEKEDDSNEPHIYSGETVAENLSPVMGGFVDAQGNLITFTFPILDEHNFKEVFLSAKVNSFSNQGAIEVLHDFQNNTFATGIYHIDTSANTVGWIPEGVKVDLTGRNDADFLMSHNGGSILYKYAEGNISGIGAKEGIISLTTNTKDEVFFITSPVFTSGFNPDLVTPPVIYKMDTANAVTEFYRFPDSQMFEFAGSSGSDGAMYPTDIIINISSDNDDNLFVCFGYDNLIYKLDEYGNISEFRNDIFCPASITFDRKNVPYVVSGPKFIDSPTDGLIMEKPLEVYKLSDSNNDELIYSSEYDYTFKGLKPHSSNENYTVSDANFNLSYSQVGNVIFLEDPKKGEVILIK